MLDRFSQFRRFQEHELTPPLVLVSSDLPFTARPIISAVSSLSNEESSFVVSSISLPPPPSFESHRLTTLPPPQPLLPHSSLLSLLLPPLLLATQPARNDPSPTTRPPLEMKANASFFSPLLPSVLVRRPQQPLSSAAQLAALELFSPSGSRLRQHSFLESTRASVSTMGGQEDRREEQRSEEQSKRSYRSE